MLKPSLQLRIGQQLTMTPQLQQAIRLLQLPSLDLQAHVRETLETNVMLEGEDEGVDSVPDPARDREELPVRLDEKYTELDGMSTPADQHETPEVEIADDEVNAIRLSPHTAQKVLLRVRVDVPLEQEVRYRLPKPLIPWLTAFLEARREAGLSDRAIKASVLEARHAFTRIENGERRTRIF